MELMVSVNCEICKVFFTVSPSRHNKNKLKQFCCSKPCLGQWKTQNSGVRVNCKICNKVVRYKKSHLKQILNPTCGMSCKRKMQGIVNSLKNPRQLKFDSYEDKYFHEKCLDLRSRAKAKKIDFNLTYQNLKELYLKQNKSCFYSGYPLNLVKTGKIQFDTLSVDRIDSNKGYTIDNIVLCVGP